MRRKLALALTFVLSTSLVVASNALAVIPADAATGSDTVSSSTSGGFRWLDVTLGVAAAVVVVAGLAAAAVVGRSRRRSAILHA